MYHFVFRFFCFVVFKVTDQYWYLDFEGKNNSDGTLMQIFPPLSKSWLHLLRQLVCLWVIQWWIILFARKNQVLRYLLELCHPNSLHVASIMWPGLFGFAIRLLIVGSVFWKLIQLISLGTYSRRLCKELCFNTCVRTL